MQKGNLYWEISFTALYHGATGGADAERINVSVNAHDFTDAYNKAEKMYSAVLKARPDTVHCAVVTLRDDGTAIPSERYAIYQTNYIHEEDLAEFFSVGADKCLRLTARA